MKYIIDTHILLWYLFDAEQLPENAKQVIEGDNEICVSIASLWEIAIKQSIGKLNIDKSISQIEEQCKLDDIGILNVFWLFVCLAIQIYYTVLDLESLTRKTNASLYIVLATVGWS